MEYARRQSAAASVDESPQADTMSMSLALAADPQQNITVGKNPGSVAVSGNRVYVANESSNSLSVFDTSTGQTTNIALAGSPSALALNSDGSRAYVTVQGFTSYVNVIDTSTKKVVGKVAVASPAGIAVSPDNSRIFVTHGGSNTVSVIDAVSLKLVKKITVGSQPAGIAVSPDGGKLYVTTRYSDSLAIVNVVTNAVTTVKVGDSPRGVALSQDGGTAYVASYDGTVSIVDTVAKREIARISTGITKQTAGLAISPDGDFVYVANGNDTISVIDTNTKTVIQTITADSAPEAGAHYVAVAEDGRHIYVTDARDGMLRVISTASLVPNNPPHVDGYPIVSEPDFDTSVVTGSLNVSDPDGDQLTYTITDPPARGAVVVNADGTFTYTPTQAARFRARQPAETSDAFAVTISDGEFSTEVPVNVTIYPATIFEGVPLFGVPTHESTDIVVTKNYAYIVNYGDNAVLVLDTTRNVPVGFIGVGRGPVHAAISPDQGRLFVVNSVDRTVSVINTSTNTLIDTNSAVAGVNSIPLPGGLPNGLAVSPDGGRLYVTDWGGTVSVIDTATYTRIDTNASAPGVNDIAAGGNLLGPVVVSPDGRTLYVARYPDNGGHGQGSIAVIDTVTGTAATPPINFGLAAYTDDLVMSPDGTKLYVLHSPTDPVPGYEPAGISVIDTATNAVVGTTIVVIDPARGSARSLVLGPDGTVAFVANDNETVAVVDVMTHTPLYTVDTFAEPAGGNRSIALSPDGRWMYVVDEEDGSVYPRTVSSP